MQSVVAVIIAPRHVDALRLYSVFLHFANPVKTNQPPTLYAVRHAGLVAALVIGCATEKTADQDSASLSPDSSRVVRGAGPAPASIEQLIDPRIPRAVAGQEGWKYQQRVSADLDGDSVVETAVLISDVSLDARGQPMWEHGHRWQVYVEEPDGTRTYLYARFLPNGKLTAELTQPQSTNAPTITLIEQSPTTLAVYEIAYNGVGKAEVGLRFERTLRSPAFIGAPRP
jgi:hypothetical protein